MKPEEIEEWPCLQCGQCVYFSVDADREESKCKRLDHKKYKFAVPWFKSYDCGQYSPTVCEDFAPSDTCKWLVKHWDGIYGYFGDGYIPKKEMWLTIGDDTSVRYSVSGEDWWKNTFVDGNGELKWKKKQYYKRSQSSPTGYILITERNLE